ncbi:hypothetical protein BVRB_6g127970 [Beta vulgaris subsp. vulgaris]|uniref:uncharacterized protein LOC104894933 n=1 Tax=Beta vulgaris subsp. vulgaris TaxID=3555 RepID=UPI0005402DB5|nr:uncharacterized protein LOC104894933 [Beta vulgaris subsp. vulgaris]KMT09821.1 hypothetical protein BVRB_6g127970 [Beta vulgaris subsp. vulgaris]
MVVMNKEIKMLGDQHFNRIDILEIKIQIGKKLGSERAGKYFGLLDSFFGFKLAKSEFDKLCIAAIGRENVCLHNRLLRSILKNACFSKTPPPKGRKLEEPVVDKVANGYQRSCLQSLCRDVLPLSPRRGRTPGFRDRRSKDRPSPLGPHGKPNPVASCKDLAQKALEQQSATELLSLGSRPIEVNSVEDGEEVDQAAISPGIHSRSPVTPPLGIPWNGKGNRKVLSSLTSSAVHVESCQKNGDLPNTSSLRKLLEQKLEKEGMGISLDCVNLLNNGLDTFLKRLIKPSLELANSRFGNDRLKRGSESVNGLNGVWPERHLREPISPPSVSILDFRTAMELNPRVLGEDWPTQLEKVCLREFESGFHD